MVKVLGSQQGQEGARFTPKDILPTRMHPAPHVGLGWAEGWFCST